MSISVRRSIIALVLFAFLSPTPALARAPKKYQVTGKVLEVADDLIVVQKDDEKWEIGRNASTKVTGKLAVGAKVTIEYTMSAATVEVKPDKAAPRK
jgi:hypothetical protein